MDKWLMALILFGGIVYFIGGMPYIWFCVSEESFLCKIYKGMTTKVGWIIFLMIDIVMLPWTLIYYLFKGIIVLFNKIIFKEDK